MNDGLLMVLMLLAVLALPAAFLISFIRWLNRH